MKALGTHLLIELFGCKTNVLNEIKKIEEILIEAALLAGVTIVDSAFHKFHPQGVSGVVIIAESHLSVHTWPEYKYAACDIFVCGEDNLNPKKAAEYLISQFKANNFTFLEIKRGLVDFQNLILGYNRLSLTRASFF